MHDRRNFLLAGAAGLGLVSTVRGAEGRKPSLRAGHITDIHISSQNDAPKGVAALFDHMFGQKDWTPELILNTGDSVSAIDGKTTGKAAQEQIDVWKAAVKNLKVPMKACLGNHDVWNGTDPVDEAQGKKKLFGLMTEVLGLPAPYYSFDHGGWHFVVLNSVCNWPTYGELSEEQFKWLEADLKKTKSTTPVCVLSHLPIVSITSSLYGNGYRKADGVLIPKVWQHVDCWEISEVFRRHPNVKLCLSGHMHTWDRCEYRGVWYICGGAGSGSWWKGAEYGFPPCYGAIDFYGNGEFDYRFTDYGWKARQWRGKELKAKS